MSGGKKNTKKEKTDKAFEIWFRLNFKKDFKQKIRELKKHRNDDNYYIQQYFLLKQYGYPITPRLIEICDNFVFGNKTKPKKKYLTGTIQSPSEKEIKDIGKGFIKFWIEDGVTIEEVVETIKKRWPTIRKIIEQQGMPKVKRIKKTENKDIVKLVLKYNIKSKDQLLKMNGTSKGVKIDKLTLIENIIRKKHGFRVSPTSISQYIHKYK